MKMEGRYSLELRMILPCTTMERRKEEVTLYRYVDNGCDVKTRNAKRIANVRLAFNCPRW
jgi:hypothetical protein